MQAVSAKIKMNRGVVKFVKKNTFFKKRTQIVKIELMTITKMNRSGVKGMHVLYKTQSEHTPAKRVPTVEN